jgi:hypothetical protein
MSDAQDDTNQKKSERYELNEIFEGESPVILGLFQIAGQAVLVALLVLAFLYVFNLPG